MVAPIEPNKIKTNKPALHAKVIAIIYARFPQLVKPMLWLPRILRRWL